MRSKFIIFITRFKYNLIKNKKKYKNNNKDNNSGPRAYNIIPYYIKSTPYFHSPKLYRKSSKNSGDLD